jgi:dihydroorotate dehydrogenase (NAD+) catalytic subunit
MSSFEEPAMNDPIPAHTGSTPAKHDLTFTPPIMNASGCLGFAPDTHGLVDFSRFGAFITNPVSLLPRTPAQGERYLEFAGGFLLHAGLPNPGLSSVLRKYSSHWRRSPVPVIVHLFARNTSEITRLARQLEGVEGVTGLEIGFSDEVNNEMVTGMLQAASGELPIIARLPLERCIELAGIAIQAGAFAVSLAPPRGSLPAKGGGLVRGRLYGPAIFPMALKVVQQMKALGIPAMGSGGIYTPADIQAMLAAGAAAVQLDSVLWRGADFIWPAER